MPIILGGHTLPEGLIWEDRNMYAPVSQVVRRTVGGRPVVFSGPLISGRPITLTSQQDQGWATLELVTALQLIASDPGATLNLTLEGLNYNVLMRHNEPPAFEATPLIPRSEPQSGDYFLIKLRLITV